MSRAGEDYSWDRFIEKMRDYRHRFDGVVPVALICLPALGEAENGMDVDAEGRSTIMWPPGLTNAVKADILRRAAKRYEDGSVRTT